MNTKTPCLCCGDAVANITKRFDGSLGFVCVPCHEFLASEAMTRATMILDGALEPEEVGHD